MPKAESRSTQHATRSTLLPPFRLLSEGGTLNIPPATGSVTNQASRNTNLFALRLTNSATPLKELMRSDTAIILENALLDTTRPTTLPIPDQLRSPGDPGHG